MPASHYEKDAGLPDSPTAKAVYVVEEQPNPSTDGYVLPALSAFGVPVNRCGFRDLPANADLAGALVVFVRYVPPQWARQVHAARKSLGGIVFFMDDDVLDVNASVQTPWHYRFKLARLAAGRLGWLRAHGATFWVSTPYLKSKYAALRPRLVLPSPTPAAEPRRVFYHGTASHDAEIRWLRTVIEEAGRRNARLSFEIVGGPAHHRLYRDLPSVTVVHQMKWPAYQSFIGLGGRHIGLAPLLDRPFNRGRSYTKFFDITRAGAAGIYAADSAYAEVVEHRGCGLLAGPDTDAWVAAILELADDEQLRARLLNAARARTAELAAAARDGYRSLTEPASGKTAW